MLMNHKNFLFTQIPDKTDDVIFLKSPKPCFWAIFDHFHSFLPDEDFYQKIRLYFIGPFRPRLGVQKEFRTVAVTVLVPQMGG